jgi:hypothetical protein
MKTKHDENEKTVRKQKSKHKLKNSIANAIRYKFQMTQIHMTENYQK